ncbi:MAG TPA: SDR family oxidoreductase [Usitatibacter sp.]|nr:SDR family oxidoreductase [Usitatibacter sp.]
MDYTLKPLDQQVVVITGPSSGIGLATAVLAFDRGAKLVLASRSEKVLEELERFVNDNGGEAIHVVADVGRRVDMEAVATAAIERFGRIDTWINNAGVSIYGKLEEGSEADHRRLFDTNFWGVVNGSLAALPHIRANGHGGAIINVGSEVSDAIVPLQGMYSASKHAVKGFTDALRVELLAAKEPICVTLIQPTAVNTPYPEHARNYLDKEPKLPSPQIDPKQVALAILEAATRPARDVKVGAMSKMNTLTWKLAPKLADWMATKYVDKQNYDAPPIDPAGTLYKPGETGRIHGRPPEARI